MAMFLLIANYAFAQEGKAPISEFEAFKLKLQQATGQGKQKAAKKDNNSQSPLNNPAPTIGANNSPLGAAANLPVGSSSPIPRQNVMTNHQRMQSGGSLLQKRKEAAKRRAFEAGMEQLMPLEPSQIRELLEEFKKNREASETPIAVPKPKIEVRTVSMDPSADPVQIKTANGYVTTVTILDATGAPWAIQDVSWAGKFTVTGGDAGSHILRIIPTAAHGAGNISIRLVDLITPITFSIIAGLDEVHYRFDARVPKSGPLAKTPIIDTSAIQATSASVGSDTKMVKFLEGVPPSDANQLVLNGVDERTKAWRTGEGIYLRTPMTLLSPSWDASVSSADGMNVYSLMAAPVLLLSDQGRMVKAYIVNELGDL